MTRISPRALALFGCYLLVSLCCSAQSAREHVQKGDKYYLKKDFRNALASFTEALALEPEDALTNFKAGVSSLDQKQYEQALRFLKKAHSLRADIDPDMDYHLGLAYQHNHQYREALSHFQILKSTNKRLAPIATSKITECIAGDSLMRLPALATVHPVDGNVNTDFSEFAPLISADGQTMFFSSDRSEDAYHIKSGVNANHIFVTHRDGDGWSKPARIIENVNARANEVATSVSADGTMLLIYYEEGAGDIYTSTKENGVWSQPVPLNRFINHPDYRETAATVSADGTRLYFSSNRPGGKGGFDIYVCEKVANGDWGRPSNLGSSINSKRDELTPFIHADGKTLYFSSNGHLSLGDHDLYRTTFENGKWTTPQNLGYPINTSANETFLVVSPDGKTGYFSSRRKPGQTDADIYTIAFSGQASPTMESFDPEDNMQDETKPAVTMLRGSVIDVHEATALQARVTLVDNKTREIVARQETDNAGAFQLAVPRGGNFGLTTEKAGYLFNSMNFDLPPFDHYQEIDTHVLMTKAKIGSKVVLKNIFFDTNESSLKDESMTELENIRDILLRNAQWRVQINGHTDNTGHPETNRALSLKRAEAVVDYLIKQGIPSRRLQAKGFGSDRPLVSNDDEKDGRQINRRTEIEIIE